MVSFGHVRSRAQAMQGSFQRERTPSQAGRVKAASARPFDLLRWFSIASLLALVPVAAGAAIILSHFVTLQALDRDAGDTAQLVRNSVSVEAAQNGVSGLGRFLDQRVDAAAAGLDPGIVAHARQEVFERLEGLPDARLTTVYAPDGTILWSTDKSRVGQRTSANASLAEAIATRADVVRQRGLDLPTYADFRPSTHRNVLIEEYVPLTDAGSDVVSVVEVDKQPASLVASIHRAQLLVWATTLGGSVLVYVALSSIVRRGARLLSEQHLRLVEAESQVFAGEMATALAHSLRNPLAGVRSSAELALCCGEEPVRKNARDIITQVDFLSQWIRELLLYSRPAAGDSQPVDLCAVLHSVLDSFRPALDRAQVRVLWDPAAATPPKVKGNATLVTQALHSVVSNAVEAMPRGGEMRIELGEDNESPGVDVVISDTGVGMSNQQLATAFRPFQTSKPQGLGVGLPMLKRAMERFGGFVTVASAGNAGTQVRLHFRT